MTLRITLFSRKFPIKLPNDPSYSIHVFYKGRFQKKNSLVAEINLSMEVLYQIYFKIL